MHKHKILHEKEEIVKKNTLSAWLTSRSLIGDGETTKDLINLCFTF